MEHISGGGLPVFKPEPFAKIKALVFDLDGTILAPGAVLTERTINAIRACAAKGLRIIIATGRAVEAAEKFRIALGVSGPMVYYNGAITASMPEVPAASREVKVLRSVLLDKEAVDFCAGLGRSMGVYFQAFFPGPGGSGGLLISETEGPERDYYFSHTGILAQTGSIKEALEQPGLKGCVKGMFIAEAPAQEALRPRLESRLGNSVYIARTKANFLEILNARATKGEGLAAVLEKTGIKKEETIAFGDEENDLPMFAAAGYSAAPANANEKVKAAADFITASNEEDGVAAFLENHFLDRKA